METITIVGGGVAGLALAGGLDPARFAVRLIEQRPALPQVGTAFGVWPFAMDALARLGVAGEVRARGVPVEAGRLGLFGRRTLQFHADGLWLIPRPDLLQILSDAVPASVSREVRRVEDVRAEPGDLVVAADGVGSIVRRTIWADRPRRIDCIAIRGVLPTACEQDGIGELWGGGKLFGVSINARQTTNWYAAAAGIPTEPAAALGWARAAFADFGEVVQNVLAAAEPAHTLVNQVIEARAVTRLVRDRYVLTGDAAHAMSPNLGRGAGESLADAAALAAALNSRGARAGARAYARQRLVKPQLVRLGSAALRRLSLAPWGPGHASADTARRLVNLTQ